MRLDVAGRSDVGKVRSNNDDRYAIRPDLPDGGLLCIVADGMGGYASGDLAATLAVEAVLDGVEAGVGLASAAATANAEIHRRSLAEPDHRGMGTTLTCVVVRDGQAQFVHAGDSRMYLIRDGTARQLTTDHSWVAEEVRAGRLTAEEARHSSKRNLITRALGMDQDVAVDSGTCVLVGGDALLLCSDGVHTMVSDDELVSACGKPAEQGSGELVGTVIARGAPDNATAVIVRVLSDGVEQYRGAVTRPLPDLAATGATGNSSVAEHTAPPVVAEADAVSRLPDSEHGRPGQHGRLSPSVSSTARPSGGARHWPFLVVLLATLVVLGAIVYIGFFGGAP